MLQKAKSTLLKVLICVCLVCCLVAMFVAVTACNKTEAPTVVGGHVDTNGHLILEMSDGSTSDAGLVAQPGTPGTNGTNGAPGIGIKTVTINNDGDLVITLDNDKEIVVKIPDYSVNCVDGKEHVWTDLHKVVDANCISGETWLTVCRRPGCNAMYLSQKGDPNPDNHLNLVDADTKPTCTKAGNTDQICKDCGKTIKGQEVAALGHTPYRDAEGKAWRGDVSSKPADVVENWVPVVDDVSIFCLEGGEEALICADCHEEVLDTKDSPAPGHLLVGEWTITQRPTEDETGLASGACDRCGQTTIELPKLGEWDRNQANKGMCTEGNVKAVETTYTYTYHYTDDSVDPAKAETHDFTFTVKEDVKHEYNGLAIYQTGEITGNAPVYDDITDADVAAAAKEGKTLKAFEHFANSPNDCTVVGFASFECETCHGTILIRVRGTNHDLDETTVVSEQKPTCTEAGWIEYNCKRGADDPATKHTYKKPVPALGHSWVVDEEASNLEGSPAKLVVECSVCHEKDEIEAENLKTETVEATCLAAGKTVYTYDYTLEGGEKVTDAKTEIVIPQLFHTVTKDGKSFVFDKSHTITTNTDDPYELEDIAKDLGYESISALLEDTDVAVSQYSNSHPTCEEPGFVSFKCSAGCKGSILVAVRGEHNWQPDATYDVEGSCQVDDKHPDGIAPEKGYSCPDCGDHKGVPTGEPIPAHVWEVEVATDGSKKVSFSCKNCDATDEGSLDTTRGTDEGGGTTTVAATCATPTDENKNAGKGSITYYYTDPSGKQGEKVVETPRKTEHTLGTITDIIASQTELQRHTLGEFIAAGADKSKAQFSNSNPTCKDDGYITITCDVCGESILLHLMGDHDLGDKQVKAATCTEDGYTYQKCSKCDREIVDESSKQAATGHDLNIAVEVQPTVDQVGSAKVTCSKCTKVNETVELPKLSDTTFWKRAEKASSCTVPGNDTYSHEFNYDGTKETLEVVVERELTDHELEEKLLEWYSEDGLTHYWGHLCKKCNQLIVDHKEKLEQLTEPEEGEYYLSYFQAKLNDGKGERRYFTGKPSGFYYATSADIAEAAVVTLQKSGEDGWVIKVGEQFLEIVKNEDHYNVVLSDTQTEGVVWKWNASVGVFTVTIGDGEYYLGTYDNFNTVSASNVTRITGENAGNRGVSQFVAVLATLAEDAAE